MRFFLLILLALSFQIAKALPPVLEMMKYIGMSAYQPEFTKLYEELQALETPKHFNYDENDRFYDNTKFVFNQKQQLVEMRFNKQMPFGMREGMPKFWAKFKLRMKGVDKETHLSKDGYLINLDYWNRKVDVTVVQAGPELLDKRKAGPYVINGHTFPSIGYLSDYLQYKKNDFFLYLVPAEGSCISGDCDRGQGVMEWRNIDKIKKATFKGEFKHGKPDYGEIFFTSTRWGEGHFYNAQLTGMGVFSGTVNLTQPNGNKAELSFIYGKQYKVKNLDMGKYIYSGILDHHMDPVWDPVYASEYKYPDRNVWVFPTRKGKIQGGYDYNNGVYYRGDLGLDLVAHGSGRWIDSIYGGKLVTYFNHGKPNHKVWNYRGGVKRQGPFDLKKGFNGEVVSTYETYYSVYTVKGKFVEHKPEGTHLMVEETTGDFVRAAGYKNGKLTTGTDFYGKESNELMKLKEKDEYWEREFAKMVKHILSQFGRGIDVKHETLKFAGKDEVRHTDFSVPKNDALRFVIFDPFGDTDVYTLKVEAGDFGAAVYFPDVTLRRDKTDPRYYTSTRGVTTSGYDEISMRIIPKGKKKAKTIAEIFLVFD